MQTFKTSLDIDNLTLSQIELLNKGDAVIMKGEFTAIKSIGFHKVPEKGTFCRIVLDNRKTRWIDFNANGQKMSSQ